MEKKTLTFAGLPSKQAGAWSGRHPKEIWNIFERPLDI
jgi:hypothetical protein